MAVSITNYAEVTSAVVQAAREARPLRVAASDVNSIMQAYLDPPLAAVLNSFDVVTPDGQPVRWGLNWTRQAQLRARVYGPTLMLHVCEAAAREQLAVFLYGSREETLVRLKTKLGERFASLSIAGILPGRFRPLTREEQAADADVIMRSGARIVFVGMGSPRQEWWMFHMRERVQLPMLAVGAAFDFHAGSVSQAPAWMQDRGLEWLYRLGREPKRLWRRYLLVTPRYLPLVAAQAAGIKHYTLTTDLHDAEQRPCPG